MCYLFMDKRIILRKHFKKNLELCKGLIKDLKEQID